MDKYFFFVETLPADFQKENLHFGHIHGRPESTWKHQGSLVGAYVQAINISSIFFKYYLWTELVHL